MSAQNLIGRYSSTLSSSYTAGGGSLVVNSASGLPTGACTFYAIVKADGGNTEEVFLVTNVSGTTLTVTGAQEGTSASNHGSGATIIAGIITTGFLKQYGMILLEEHTASNSASLQFTNWQSSDYDEYEIHIIQILPVTNGAKLLMRVSTNGGSSYDSGSNYAWSTFGYSSAGSGSAGSQSDTSIGLLTGNSGIYSTHASSGRFTFYNPAGGADWPGIHGIDQHLTSGDQTSFPAEGGITSAVYKSTTAVNAFELLMSSGNISSGIVRVYGLAK